MVTTTVRVGESLTIGFYFKDNYQLSNTNNMIIYIGGVCVGNLRTQEPPLPQNGIYYDVRLSSQEASLMRGYRDVDINIDDQKRLVSGKI